ncbi:hypothetical protein POX_c03873 [Penicillium oxalicum]|uniref:hypothetical protein n=1 Tax=Penicillium oxalicum TaxID=69781 RepID=UPI0020B652A6|nr:hypothetical protein POX_c03873 [Penicillium oxalicum]KAI2791019.1 hypothetical protein POX_c03873 [Penicillium oxalicum]
MSFNQYTLFFFHGRFTTYIHVEECGINSVRPSDTTHVDVKPIVAGRRAGVLTAYRSRR